MNGVRPCTSSDLRKQAIMFFIHVANFLPGFLILVMMIGSDIVILAVITVCMQRNKLFSQMHSNIYHSVIFTLEVDILYL